jgi:hypothetical protein
MLDKKQINNPKFDHALPFVKWELHQSDAYGFYLIVIQKTKPECRHHPVSEIRT